MWWKILLLSLYLLILFILARILETFTYYQTGYLANRLIDPFSLSVQKLKAILDNRGVNYDSALEKRDLSEMVENSGELIESESENIDVSMLNEEQDIDPDVVVNFIGGDHFLEKVEDTKDSVWVIQVLTDNVNENIRGRMVTRKEWNKFVKILSKFGIQAGIFHCSKDLNFCKSRGWMQSQIILSMPEGNCFKDKVITKTYRGATVDHKTILKWVNKVLFQKVHKVSSYEHLVHKWLRFDSTNRDKNDDYNNSQESDICQERVKVLFVSPLKIPPMFYSVMSAKFSGRIKFGNIDLNNKNLNEELTQVIRNLEKVNSIKNNFPFNSTKLLDTRSLNDSALKDIKSFYLIITPEKLIKFGGKSGEHYDYKSFSNFLRFLHPEINDIFITSLIIMSFACCFDIIFLSEKKFSSKAIHFLWNVTKYNVFLICLWMVVLGTYKSFSPCQEIIDYLLSCTRTLCFSSIGSEMRNDWYQYVQCDKRWWLPLSTFLLVQIAFVTFKAKLLSNSYHSLEPDQPRSYVFTYLETIVNQLMQPFFSSSSSEHVSRFPSFDVDDENISDYGMMEMFIERLAVPDLWLRPIVSSQYLHDLPVWKHSGTRYPSTSSANDSDYSLEHDGDGTFPTQVTDDDSLEFPATDSNHGRTQPFIFICDKCRIALHPGRRKQSVHNKAREAQDRQSALKLGTIKAAKYLMDGNYKCTCKHDDAKSDTGTPSNSHDSNNDNDDASADRSNNDSDSIDVAEESSFSSVQKLLASITFKTSPENPSTRPNFAIPKGIIESSECSICLDRYKRGDYLCGLPCGHAYHQNCIMSWLTRDNHCCPVCRWPAYKAKPCRKHLNSS